MSLAATLGFDAATVQFDQTLDQGESDAQAAPRAVERAIGLRERLGPFRLAYLEALVRAADVRASMREDPKKWGRTSEPGAAQP